MASKLILVPEEIYRGLTSSDTGNINLDFARRVLDKTKREKTNASVKNIHYNQALARYLKLRNEYENTPSKVEITKGMRALIKRADGDDDEDEIEIEFNPTRTPRRRRNNIQQPQARQPSRPIAPQPSREPQPQPLPPPPQQQLQAHPGPSNQQSRRPARQLRPESRQRTKRPHHIEIEEGPRKRGRTGAADIGLPVEDAEWLSEDENDGPIPMPALDQRPSTSDQPPSSSLDQRPSTSDQAPSSSSSADEESALLDIPIYQLTAEGLVRRFHIWFNRNRGKYRVQGDTILDMERKPVRGSSLQKSLRYIIEKRENRGVMLRKQPPGTKIIEDRINRDTILKSWISPLLGKRVHEETEERPRNKFPSLRPKRWTQQ